jgi:hypothetical protein
MRVVIGNTNNIKRKSKTLYIIKSRDNPVYIREKYFKQIHFNIISTLLHIGILRRQFQDLTSRAAEAFMILTRIRSL